MKHNLLTKKQLVHSQQTLCPELTNNLQQKQYYAWPNVV